MNVPTVTLSNGLRVANFSSPHAFSFVDGYTLEACESDRVKALSLEKEEQEWPFPGLSGVTAVTPRFKLSHSVLAELRRLQDDDNVDVVIVPFPMLQALKDEGLLKWARKAATISVADRQTKAIHIDRFCR